MPLNEADPICIIPLLPEPLRQRFNELALQMLAVIIKAKEEEGEYHKPINFQNATKSQTDSRYNKML